MVSCACGGFKQVMCQIIQEYIIVKFAQRLCKDVFITAVRSRRCGLTTAHIDFSGPSRNTHTHVSNHLTPQNKQLLKRARQIAHIYGLGTGRY